MRRATHAALALLTTAVPALAQTSIEQLVQQLGSDDHQVSYPAYQELSRRRDAAMVPLIGKGIAEWPRNAQQYGVYLLRAQPIDVTRAIWKKHTEATSAFLRIAANAMLAQLRERGADERLAAALQQLPENERAGVVSLTYGVGDSDVVFGALRDWLHPGANGTTIMVVLNRLSRIPQRSAALRAAVEPLTGVPDTAARAAALAYLAGSDAKHAEALAALLTAEPERLGPIRGLLDGDGKLPPSLVEAIAATLPAAKSEHDVRQTAELLRKQSPGAGTNELRGLLKHDKAELRAAALEALGQSANGLDDKLLQSLLHGDDVTAALVATDVLRRRDDVSGLEVALATKTQSNEQRIKLAEVLSGFRDRRVGPLLLGMLDDAEVRVRREAWNGLQQLMRGLFPYRRFDFERSGYSPEAASRQAGVATLRAWWDAEAKPR